MSTYNDFIIDMETLDDKSTAMIIDIAVIPFNPDTNINQSFDELVKRGRKWKINLAAQKGVRTANKKTIDWWKDQSPEARANLVPSDKDMLLEDAIKEILEYLKASKVQPWKSQGWCRGQSFDFPIFVNALGQVFNTTDTTKLEPICFWNQRDIRTAIEAYSLVRNMTTTPLRKGTLDGFIAHDSIHDCAKDIIMLKTAQRYCLGLETPPASEEETDPLSVKKR